MEPSLYEEMYDMEVNYWWHRGKRYLIHRLLEKYLHRSSLPHRSRLLILGVGTGYLQAELQGEHDVVGLDFSHLSLSFSRLRGCEKLARVDLEQGLPFASNHFDGILAFDVLEHIEDDEQLLQECFRVLNPGACLFLGVPAFPSMWSQWDEMLHHKRRYRRKKLAQQFRAHHFDVLFDNYYNAVSFVPAFMIRKIKKWRRDTSSEFIPMPDAANRLMTFLFQADVLASMRLSLPFGLSCAIVGSKAAE